MERRVMVKMVRYAIVCSCLIGSLKGFTADIAELKSKAEQGDAEAMCELARCYRDGLGIERNQEHAASWTQRAASNGCIRAVGLCYRYGYGVSKDLKKSAEYYEAAAKKGDPIAMKNLGICYLEGEGVERNAIRGLRILELAAEKGNLDAIRRLGSCYHMGDQGVPQSDEKALYWYRKGVALNDHWTMLLIGCLYDNPRQKGFERSMKEAIYWYRQAAEKDPDAQYELAICYQLGKGIIKNEEKARELMETAANGGSMLALQWLGGRALKKSAYSDAYGWFRKLAALGVDYGKFQCARLIFEEEFKFKEGSKPSDYSKDKAFEDLKKLGDSENKWVRRRSCSIVADTYEFGRLGVKEDKEEALRWYEKAAEKNDPDALRELEGFERKCFDEDTIKQRKKERLERGIGSIEEDLREAAKHVDQTLTFKGFYLGMSVRTAYRLLMHYDGEGEYHQTEAGIKGSFDGYVFDHPSGIVVKAKDGFVTEFVFSRRLIDKIFGSKGKSPDEFIAEISRMSPLLGKMHTKTMMVPDCSRRESQALLIMQMQGPSTSSNPFEAMAEAQVKMNNARTMLREMKRPGVCYHQTNEKGFTLEIMPCEGNPKNQVLFFVLKSTKSE